LRFQLTEKANSLFGYLRARNILMNAMNWSKLHYQASAIHRLYINDKR